MSEFLRQLLGAKEPLFSHGLKKLEKSTGHSATDVRLIADITEKTHKTLRALKLDVVNTTAREIYHALIECTKNGSFQDVLMDDDYVLFDFNGEIVSFNAIDVIESAHHQLKFKDRLIDHGRRSLRGEFLARYIDHKRTHSKTTKETLNTMGLFFDTDEWYNTLKVSRYKKTTKKISVDRRNK